MNVFRPMKAAACLLAATLLMGACGPSEPATPAMREVAAPDTTVRRPFRLQIPSPVFDSLSRGVPVITFPSDSSAETGQPAALGRSVENVVRASLNGVRFRDSLQVHANTAANKVTVTHASTGALVKEWTVGMRPGEFRRPMTVLTNDSLLAVLDFENRRIQMFDPSLNVTRVLPLGSESYWRGYVMTPRYLYKLVSDRSGAPPGWRLMRQRLDWALPDTLPGHVYGDIPDLPPMIGTPSLMGNNRFIVIGAPYLPYTMVLNAEGRHIAMIAHVRSNADEMVAQLREGVAETKKRMQVNDFALIGNIRMPVFATLVGIDADGWLTLMEGASELRVDLNSITDEQVRWTRRSQADAQAPGARP